MDIARKSSGEARTAFGLKVAPQFRQGNAEALDLPDASVDCVYSCGVLHHTPDTECAIGEVYRVLRPGGEAYIAVYRRPSIKVGVAKTLRALQVDWMTRRNRTFYYLLLDRHFPQALGTMLLECFGVPVMEWYSRADMGKLFARFEILSVEPVGYNLPFRKPVRDGSTRFGYMWLAHVRKDA